MFDLASFFADPESKRRRAFLRSIPLFRGMRDKDVALIQQSLTDRLFRKGEVIFKEGDASRALLIIETGRVEIYKTINGKRRTLNYVDAGGFIGEMALLDDSPRSATAEATVDSNVFFLHKNKLDGLAEDFPAIGAAIMTEFAKALADRFRRLEARLLAGAPATAPAQGAAAEDGGEKLAELERALAGMAVELDRTRRALEARGGRDR